MARKNAKSVKPSAPPTIRETINHDKNKKGTTKTKEEKKVAAVSGVYDWILKLLAVVAALAVTYYLRELDGETVRVARYISRKEVTDHLRLNVSCISALDPEKFVPGCHLPSDTMCGRVVMDNFVKPEQVTQLLEIAEIGMESRSKIGGPTIMDINTGFVRNSEGLVNIYQPERRIPNEDKPGIKRFTKKQFNLYRSVVQKIRRAVMKEFGLEELYFSAPTFMARLIGNDSWTPAEIHDEYWHPHVDKENTRHYDYSSLLYLSDFDEEFTGGLFSFIDEDTETVIEPARGRLLMFTAGSENLHVVRKVRTGTRYAMSIWFSCDENKEFKNFLDGTMHTRFRRT